MQDQSRNIPFIGRLEPRPIPTTTLDLRGKHRRIAELNRLEQEIKLLKEELDELEHTVEASTVCKEVLHTVENRPDPLLPITVGPENTQWNHCSESEEITELDFHT
ncbi:hypothetical protein SUGI_0145110 [Cryptomeria japonica]|nr:hypothetical protein SUGI_0145110 [Cryptomeria japonica]